MPSVESCFVPLGNHQRKSQSSINSVHCEKLSLWWEKIRRQKLQPFSCEVMRDGLRQGWRHLKEEVIDRDSSAAISRCSNQMEVRVSVLVSDFVVSHGRKSRRKQRVQEVRMKYSLWESWAWVPRRYLECHCPQTRYEHRPKCWEMISVEAPA